jgi:two-component system sensor histidine kinase UhpB
MSELLGLAHQLRPTALDDHGLVPAIAAQLKRFSAQTGVKAKLDVQGELDGLGEDEEITVYRVVQEALNNVGRHAGASSVQVELERRGNGTEVRVRDDGTGFDPGSGPAAGLGLRGMAERARVAGGELDVSSTPGGGTYVTLRLP